jgi:putative phosphoribosyl transferase
MVPRIIEEPAYREKTFTFKNRIHAGQLLAEKLTEYSSRRNTILLAVPSGGVPVGCTVSKILSIPMEVVVVRKIQIPWNTEAGFGAVTWDGETVLNAELVAQLGLSEKDAQNSVQKTRKVVDERLKRFRSGKPLPDLDGKIVILVDDGLASGFTMLAAVRAVRKQKPEKIVVAVPTASLRAVGLLLPEVDEMVCLNIRSGTIFAVADAYVNWYDLSDEEVIETLEKYRQQTND